ARSRLRAPARRGAARLRPERRARRARGRRLAPDAPAHRSRPRRASGRRPGGARCRRPRRAAGRRHLPDLRSAGARPLRGAGRARRRAGARAVKDVFRVRRMWRPRGELKPRYDFVIVGGGSHGLATAYYLAKNHGITDVAILEQSYIGSGASGRNTTIVRSNYRTPEGAAFYKRSVELYEGLSADLDFNLMFSQHGHLTLAHSDRALITSQERAEVNQLLGIDSRVVYPDEIAKLCPQLDLSDKPTWPIVGALYHAPGGIIRHDAVVWGLARGADRAGAEIHPYTQVTGIDQQGGRVTAVQTNRGRVEAGVVGSAVAGWSTLVGQLARVPLPITTHILQAFVTEPVKPFLNVIIVSSQMHVYVSQTDRGEFLIGAEI